MAYLCRWANVTLGQTCVVENTGYIVYSSTNETVDIVSRFVLSFAYSVVQLTICSGIQRELSYRSLLRFATEGVHEHEGAWRILRCRQGVRTLTIVPLVVLIGYFKVLDLQLPCRRSLRQISGHSKPRPIVGLRGRRRLYFRRCAFKLSRLDVPLTFYRHARHLGRHVLPSSEAATDRAREASPILARTERFPSKHHPDAGDSSQLAHVAPHRCYRRQPTQHPLRCQLRGLPSAAHRPEQDERFTPSIF